MAKILDQYGNPVDMGLLTAELATANIGGIRQPFHLSAVAGLSPERLGNILAAVDQGDAHEYLTLAEEMEEKEPHYHSVLSTRKLAVSSLDCFVEAASDDTKDVEIADEVTKLTKSRGFRALLADLLDALGKGYSVGEIIWDKTGSTWKPKAYEHRDPRWFRFDRFTGRELRMLDEKDPANGIALAPYKFIVHYPKIKAGLPIRGGLARLASVGFMCKSFTLKDWLTFAEVFGMPLRVGKFDASATADQKTALLRAVTNIGTDAAAIIPSSMLIEFVEGKGAAGGDKLFEGLADWLDRQTSKAVLGQTSSSDAQSTGLGSSIGDSHASVRGDYRDDDAWKLSATLEATLVRWFVDLNWGPQDAYPTLSLGREAPEDLKLLAESLAPFIDRGLRVEASVIRDKFNLEEPDGDSEVLKPQGGATQPSPFAGAVDPNATPAPMPGDVPTGQGMAHAKRNAAVELMRLVISGSELTADQRSLLELLSTGGGDEIERLADSALKDSSKVMDPVLEPIMQIARAASSFEEMQKRLESAKLDSSELVRAVATLTFMARGLGDAKDRL